MTKTEKIRLAEVFSYAAHCACGQTRKYTGEAYFTHPERVAKMVAETPGANEDMVCAAYLHDVVEDTQVLQKDINHLFGPDVAVLVNQLTNVSKPEDGNRETRKALDRAHSAKACAEAKTIKLADVLDNLTSITQYDKGFAKKYVAEKKMLLPLLKEGDPGLWIKVHDLIEAWDKENSE